MEVSFPEVEFLGPAPQLQKEKENWIIIWTELNYYLNWIWNWIIVYYLCVYVLQKNVA